MGLNPSGTHSGHDQQAKIAKDMLTLICNIFGKHKIRNKLAARRRFSNARMQHTEKEMPFATGIRQLAATLKAVIVPIKDSEGYTDFLNGFLKPIHSLISAFNAAHIDNDKFAIESVQSSCIRKEQD